MITIYLVIECTGEYDSYEEETIMAWTTDALANAHMDAIELSQQNWNTALECVHEFCINWGKERPGIASPQLEDYPRWHNIRHQDITPEMRASRQVILDRNTESREKYSLAVREHDAQRLAAAIQYSVENNVDDRVVAYLRTGKWPYKRYAEYLIKQCELKDANS